MEDELNRALPIVVSILLSLLLAELHRQFPLVVRYLSAIKTTRVVCDRYVFGNCVLFFDRRYSVHICAATHRAITGPRVWQNK